MKKLMISTKDLLSLAGLSKKGTLLSRALPIAAGVSAGLVAGAGVAFALLTPSRREQLRRLWTRRDPDAMPAWKKGEVVHSDAPGTDTARKLNGSAPAVHA